MNDWQKWIVSDPTVIQGKPVIVGTRITVESILDYREKQFGTKVYHSLSDRMMKQPIREYDTVVLAHDLESLPLKAGDVGAVVHVYPDGEAFEVEFVTGEGKTVAVVTLTKDDIRSMHEQEILHVRALTA